MKKLIVIATAFAFIMAFSTPIFSSTAFAAGPIAHRSYVMIVVAGEVEEEEIVAEDQDESVNATDEPEELTDTSSEDVDTMATAETDQPPGSPTDLIDENTDLADEVVEESDTPVVIESDSGLDNESGLSEEDDTEDHASTAEETLDSPEVEEKENISEANEE
jgi:hypothetical protein